MMKNVLIVEEKRTSSDKNSINFEGLVYPQSLAENQEELESLFQAGKFKGTYKRFNGVPDNDLFYEIEYKGKRYVRAMADFDMTIALSDGERLSKGQSKWFNVEPIRFNLVKQACISSNEKEISSEQDEELENK